MNMSASSEYKTLSSRNDNGRMREHGENVTATDATLESGLWSKGGKTGQEWHLRGCPALSITTTGDRNWEKGIAWSRVYGAALRHLNAWYGGENLDPETGRSHLWHAATNIMFLMEFENTHPELDDRPSNKKSPEVSPGEIEMNRVANAALDAILYKMSNPFRPIMHRVIISNPSIPQADGDNSTIDVEFTDVTDAPSSLDAGELVQPEREWSNGERSTVQSTSDDRSSSNPPLWDPVEVAQSNHKA